MKTKQIHFAEEKKTWLDFLYDDCLCSLPVLIIIRYPFFLFVLTRIIFRDKTHTQSFKQTDSEYRSNSIKDSLILCH